MIAPELQPEAQGFLIRTRLSLEMALRHALAKGHQHTQRVAVMMASHGSFLVPMPPPMSLTDMTEAMREFAQESEVEAFTLVFIHEDKMLMAIRSTWGFNSTKAASFSRDGSKVQFGEVEETKEFPAVLDSILTKVTVN